MTTKKTLLQSLEGMTVTAAETIHDYVQLAFGKEIGLSIYNDRDLIPETIEFRKLVGKTIVSVAESTDSIIFKFLDGAQLVVDMHRQAYNEPEALQFNQQGKPPIIWN